MFGLGQIVMNRIATLTDPEADQYAGKIDSEWVLGHHLKANKISVRLVFVGSNYCSIYYCRRYRGHTTAT